MIPFFFARPLLAAEEREVAEAAVRLDIVERPFDLDAPERDEADDLAAPLFRVDNRLEVDPFDDLLDDAPFEDLLAAAVLDDLVDEEPLEDRADEPDFDPDEDLDEAVLPPPDFELLDLDPDDFELGDLDPDDFDELDFEPTDFFVVVIIFLLWVG